MSVCFNYKNFDPKDLCTKLYEGNVLMVGFGHFHAKGFVRLVTINGENTHDDLRKFFNVLEQFADNNSELIKQI